MISAQYIGTKRPKELKNTPLFLTKTDKGYHYSKYDFVIKEEALYIKKSGYAAVTQWFVLNDFRKYSALQILAGCESFIRPLNDGVLEVWHKQGLSLGFVK